MGSCKQGREALNFYIWKFQIQNSAKMLPANTYLIVVYLELKLVDERVR
jgi:hypothetical protein